MRGRDVATSLLGAAIVAVTAAGCTSDLSAGAGARSPSDGWRGHADRWGFIPDAAPSLRVVVNGPRAVSYVPSLLGAGPLPATVRVKNVGATAAALPSIVLSYRAARDGVPFACATSEPRAREPRTLEPGEALWLERELDCSLPLPGRYDIDALMAVGAGAASRALEEAGTFSIEVAASPRGPARCLGRPGLFVAIAGPTPVRPMTADRWAREGYVGLLAVTNAAPTAADFGDVHLAIDVTRGGDSVECVSGAREIGVPGPTTLPPGHTFVARFPVRCNLAAAAEHDLFASVTLDGSRQGPGVPTCRPPRWPISVTDDALDDRATDALPGDVRAAKNPWGL